MKAVIQHLRELTDSKELLASRPNPVLPAFVYLVLTILLVASIWSYFGEIDEYIKAKGVIRPNQKISNIQNVLAGKVIHINYEEGKKVNHGDILYIIDHTQLDLEQAHTSKELERATIDLKNLKILRQSYLDGKNYFEMYISDGDILSKNSCEYYTTRYLNYDYHVQQLEKIIEEKQENYDAYQKLYDAMAVPRKDFANIKYQLSNVSLDLQKYKLDTLMQTENDITTAEKNVDKLQKQLNQINTNIHDAIVKAPIDGIINVIAEINQGDYLGAQSLVITIVPENNMQYKVNIYVNNKDIAKIKEGQKIHYDFFALPFKEYGEVTGVVTKVSTDAKSEPNSNGNQYLIEATVENKPMYSYKGAKAEMKVGMVCDVRIVTESKKILYYLLEKINLRE